MKTSPIDFKEIEMLMSNFDHTIDEGLSEKLKSGKFTAEYCAWKFHGMVWFEDSKFHCMIKKYTKHIDTIIENTLEEIMETACSKYGAD